MVGNSVRNPNLKGDWYNTRNTVNNYNGRDRKNHGVMQIWA